MKRQVIARFWFDRAGAFDRWPTEEESKYKKVFSSVSQNFSNQRGGIIAADTAETDPLGRLIFSREQVLLRARNHLNENIMVGDGVSKMIFFRRLVLPFD